MDSAWLDEPVRRTQTMTGRIFTVFGVTGQQGGALIRYLLDHPVFSKEYRFRGVTRNASKPAAVGLTEKGVEIVEVPKTLY